MKSAFAAFATLFTAAVLSAQENETMTITSEPASVRMRFPGEDLIRRFGAEPSGMFGMRENSPSGTLDLPLIPSHIQLDPIWIIGNGTIGWANSNPGFGDNISYGRIYVYGIQIPQGVPWIGNVFPAGRTITCWSWKLPCFAVSPELAELVRSQIP